MAFGEKMRREYESRYAVHFETTYHLDDPLRFPEDPGIDTEPCRIVYTGSIGLRRYEPIQDLVDAVRTLPAGGRHIQIVLHCSGLPKDVPRKLLDAPKVEVLPLPTHEELPHVVASASVLFLPESFSVAPELIEFAISSKAHLYMMCGRPILVYDPAYSGTVDYAIREKWGLAIAERSVAQLKEGLAALMVGGARLQPLQLGAAACIRSNHDLTLRIAFVAKLPFIAS